MLSRAGLNMTWLGMVVLNGTWCNMSLLDGSLFHVPLLDRSRLDMLLNGSRPRLTVLWLNLTRLSMTRFRVTSLGRDWPPLRGYRLLGCRVWSHVLSMLEIMADIFPRHRVDGCRLSHDLTPGRRAQSRRNGRR